jgi:BirA family transcriptional regulator, biotin operon repressor / biotin---[acetyl-CoA-carboxylase] ligase
VTPERAPLSTDIPLGPPWRQLDIVAETGSTNADLLARAAAGTDIEGAVLVAEYQNAGRGRHGRSWTAPPRSQISVSVGVSTDGVDTDGWGWLPLLTGVAVAEAVRAQTGVAAGLKWPNDVLVGSGKLAGILAEVAAPQRVVVVGLGLNVSLTTEEAPDPRATSLTMLGVPQPDRNALLRSILRELADRIADWRATGGASPALVSDYRRLSSTLGTQVRALLPDDREVVGRADSIDELGRLRIATAGDVVTVSAGDITHLRPSAQ